MVAVRLRQTVVVVFLLASEAAVPQFHLVGQEPQHQHRGREVMRPSQALADPLLTKLPNQASVAHRRSVQQLLSVAQALQQLPDQVHHSAEPHQPQVRTNQRWASVSAVRSPGQSKRRTNT